MQVQPYGEFVVIEPDAEKKMTRGGLRLPDGVSLTEKKYIGTVIAIGDECTKVKIGDRVLYIPMQGVNFKEENIAIFKEKAIIGKVVEE